MICPNCKNEIAASSKFCMYCGAEFLEERIPYVDIEPDDPTINEYPAQPPVSSDPPPKKQGKDKKTSTFQIVIAAVVIVLILGVLATVGIKTSFFGLAGETITDAQGDKIRSGSGAAKISVKDADGTIRQITTDRSLITPAAILDEYTDVLNNLKTEAPAFTKIRYQNLPTENQNLGTVAKIVLPIIERYVTSKDAADGVQYASGNADKLPISNSSYGCLLTDTEKIQNAYSEVLENGDIKLVITVQDENNPTPLSPGATETDSAVNAMFEPYNAAEQINAIAELALSNIDFNYTKCTAELVYNKKTKAVTSVKMTMNIDVTANAYITELKARIVDITEYTDFIY